ncbi:hypothetical protein GCM10010201_31930 [Pilimelia columellifera subsp. columellifera]|uniref:D-glucuronyl C5-epimerase C-terminal domain-containing protein n=1 Tax=Pilimelia columellifera subsp. columellifera TaxID=706583 RepID=A0ABN3NRK9_9ACTN
MGAAATALVVGAAGQVSWVRLPAVTATPAPQTGPQPTGAGSASPGPRQLLLFRRAGHLPVAAPAAALPYPQTVPSRRDVGLVDEAGVRVFRGADGRTYDHPVFQGQYGIQLLQTYLTTGDRWFLDRALLQARRVRDTGVPDRGTRWLPYRFGFDLYGVPGDALAPPWHSGMAQGRALSLFARLALVTGDPTWRRSADDIFGSLTLGPTDDGPWATWVDGSGHLWLEEYPRTPPERSEQVLNGHIAAAFGLYDYWRLTGDRDAAALFDGAATTVEHWLPRGFRAPGSASRYSLRGRRPHEGYHAIHVQQLLRLHALTGQPTFARWADLLAQDFPTPQVTAPVRFAPGRHQLYHLTADGVQPAGRTHIFDATTATADRRRRSGDGVYYRIAKGPLTGRWAREITGRSTMTTVVAITTYSLPRRLTGAGPSAAYWIADGRADLVGDPGRLALVRATGWWDGRRFGQLAAGSLAGAWVRLSGPDALA